MTAALAVVAPFNCDDDEKDDKSQYSVPVVQGLLMVKCVMSTRNVTFR